MRAVNNGMLGWDKSTKRIVNWFVNGNGGRSSFMWRQLEDGKWDVWSPANRSNWIFTIAGSDSFRAKTSSGTTIWKRRE